MSRPTKLTPQLQAEILKGLSTGASRRDVAEWCGISYRSMQRWLKEGEDAEADSVYREFRRVVYRTERWVKLRLLGIIQQASENDPHLALKFLERKWPDEFGRRTVRVDAQAEVHAHVTSAPPRLEQLMADPTCAAFLEGVLNHNGSNGNGNGNGRSADQSALQAGP